MTRKTRHSIIYDLVWISTVLLSLALNYHLIRQSLHYVLLPKEHACMDMDIDPPLPPAAKTRNDLDAFPRFKGALTHLILQINQGPAEIATIKELFARWTKYPPCLAGSSPTSWAHSHVTLTMMLESAPTVDYANVLRDHFLALPTTVRDCFQTFEIRHAQLATPPTNSTLEEKRQVWRNYFWSLLSNNIKLQTPNHVALLSTNCVPIQPNWLNLLDYATRPPNEPYWVMGPLLRRTDATKTESFASLFHMSRHAIYNMADGEFVKWYLRKVKHYAEHMPIPFYEFGRWEMDIMHYLQDVLVSTDYQQASTKLRLTNVLLDLWNATINADQILNSEPDVAIVCGSVPTL